MAYKRISAVYFLADSKEDLKDIPTPKMGAECFVIKDACEYKATSSGEWVKQSVASTSSSGESVDLTGYATEDYVDSAVGAIVVPSIEGLATEKYVDSAIGNIAVPSIEGLASETYVDNAIASISIPSVEGLATEEFVNQAIVNATGIEDIYGEEHMFGLMVNPGDYENGLIDAMLAKGKGMYNFHVRKGSEGLPEAVIAKDSSCRGLCCVDTVKDTGWYGWILLFDHDGDTYVQYIRNAEPKGWKQIAFV